ncbi:hypothetical protein JG687_00013338 [Phytophthora cactorum]|uniref:PiggyBac transposable element-derived protein domain-containing protein n=1 Tax=Phytophthora cactorum TaxID=29920 RepID=A0A8T1U0N3_9STRA|nr:hypothetical protein JG687_00013338 [Phytophthora cactorum]
MFLYFLPKTLWFMIEKETNSYREACFPGIAQQQRDKQLQVQAKDPKKSVAPLEEIEEKLRRVKSIESHEIFHVIGLLVARTLCSHTDGLEKHWSARADGAVPRGTYSRYMTRDIFKTITRYLHFTQRQRVRTWRGK